MTTTNLPTDDHVDITPFDEVLALGQVLRILDHFLPFWDFDRLLKVDRKSKWRSRDLGPFLGPFWVLGLCNGYGDVGPWVYPLLCLFFNV
jgi:hypothetical protein